MDEAAASDDADDAEEEEEEEAEEAAVAVVLPDAAETVGEVTAHAAVDIGLAFERVVAGADNTFEVPKEDRGDEDNDNDEPDADLTASAITVEDAEETEAEEFFCMLDFATTVIGLWF